ncbi:MAG TPA: EpsD family peptidyl-prolyl cis-trans isomerase [Burkholderiales bacterium]|nr:EpsD family peptidyl-prolyl cis-trans isomerase [Burkholderiales bacterium]
MMNKNSFPRTRTGIAIVSAAMIIAGCGEKGGTSQVAAKVNSAEITVSQISNELTKLPPVPQDKAGEARRAVLGKLVEQQLFIQQAVSDKLDRTPKVVEDIDAAKRAILARAYLEKIASGVTQPTDEDARKYYDGNPALFSQRRIYSVQEYEIVPEEGLAEFLKASLAKGESLDGIGKDLKAKGTKFSERSGLIVPEQAPLELLPKLAAIQDGQTGVIESPKSISVVHVVSSKLQPVEFKTASNAIKQFMMNKRVKEAIDSEVGRLKAQAKIEYLGQFAKADSVRPEVPKPVSHVDQPTGADIANGVAGLK